ncbi:MAG: hypothetical protein GF353_21135 [Candidatus Lokiarchaeota archaeon]|nr:hypothetical protein [Candidatus Lokiarchaeota archaeon]
MRRDTKYEKYDMIAFSLGAPGNTLLEQDKENYKVKIIKEIYIGEKKRNNIYTIYEGLYVHFLRDVFANRNEVSWLLTAQSLTRNEVYEGPL